MNTHQPTFCHLNKRRPVIAFFNGNMHYPNYRILIKYVYDGFAGDDLDLHIYMGADLTEYVDKQFMKNLCSDNHVYSVFPYVAYDRPDLIVITMGGIIKHDRRITVTDFLSHFPDIPILMLENDTLYPGVHHILLENYSGMYELTEHLITGHNCRRLALLSGPVQNSDAVERLEAFNDALKNHGLEPAGILYGNFTPHVADQVNGLLDCHPDALMCGNDVMASTAFQIAASRGLTVGKDILITGFDDSPFAAFLEPPLTTVRQDYSLIAGTVVREVRRFLRGEELRDITIPTQVVYRKSCGCRNETTDTFYSDRQKMVHDERINQMIIQSVESSVTLRNMMFQEQNQEKMFLELGATLYHLGAKRSCILLH